MELEHHLPKTVKGKKEIRIKRELLKIVPKSTGTQVLIEGGSGRERERGGAENIITGTPEGQSRTLENTGGRAEVEMTESRVAGGRGPGVEKDGAVAVGLDLGIEIGGKGDPEAEPGAEAGIGTETGKDPMKFAKKLNKNWQRSKHQIQTSITMRC